MNEGFAIDFFIATKTAMLLFVPTDTNKKVGSKKANNIISCNDFFLFFFFVSSECTNVYKLIKLNHCMLQMIDHNTYN